MPREIYLPIIGAGEHPNFEELGPARGSWRVDLPAEIATLPAATKLELQIEMFPDATAKGWPPACSMARVRIPDGALDDATLEQISEAPDEATMACAAMIDRVPWQSTAVAESFLSDGMDAHTATAKKFALVQCVARGISADDAEAMRVAHALPASPNTSGAIDDDLIAAKYAYLEAAHGRYLMLRQAVYDYSRVTPVRLSKDRAREITT
jgi:hypothetical protein